MAAQLELSQSSSDDDDDNTRGQQRGPRRMARIVRTDYYNNDDCDVEDDDVDESDSDGVFALENTNNNKCQVLNDDDVEDYDYIPAVAAEMEEPHVGMILEVSNRPDANGDDDDEKKDVKRERNNKIRYQLTQPMDLELGTTVKHAADYAYIPVLSARVEPILVVTPSQNQNEQQQQQQQQERGKELLDVDNDGQKQTSNSKSTTPDKSLVGAEDKRSPNEWWQWWIPWSTWRQQRKQDDENGGHHHHHQERYRMKENKAFAGGSHGQVWRGTRRCDNDDDDETTSATVRTKRSRRKGRAAAASAAAADTAHQYQFPLDDTPDQQQQEQAGAAAAAADSDNDWCNESLVLKKLKVEQSFRILEAGLREVYFGHLLLSKEKQEQQQDDEKDEKEKKTTKSRRRSSQERGQMFTRYVDHFFLERSNNSSAPQLELWIVYRYAGPSLRSFLYTGSLVGDYMIFQNSRLWTQLRKSMSKSSSSSQHQNHHHHEKQYVQREKCVNESECENSDVSVVLRHTTSHQNNQEEKETVKPGVDEERQDEKKQHPTTDSHPELPHSFARDLMRTVLKQILQAAAFLHENGIVQ
jgi:hypothetical protein